MTRNDVYTVLLGLSFAMMAAACTLLYLDRGQYPAAAPPAAPALTAAAGR